MRLQENNQRSKKIAELESYFTPYTSHNIMIAFSGGVDSSLLLRGACQAMKGANTGKTVYGVTMSTTLHPSGEVALCKQVAEEIGAVHQVIEIDELKDADIAMNPVNRCYRCKKYLFTQAQQLARQLDCPHVFEGTNEDDLGVYRPGIQAVHELGIHSPLAELHFTKADIRKMAGEYGISVAERPSSPCLATRFPYGTWLSREHMHMVDQGEQYLRKQGFRNVRVRMHQDPKMDDKEGLCTARLELDVNELQRALQMKDDIVGTFHSLGFSYITLDMEGFQSGSMDKGLLS